MNHENAIVIARAQELDKGSNAVIATDAAGAIL
jgi:hypothetical protein